MPALDGAKPVRRGRRLLRGWIECSGYIGDFQSRLVLTVLYFTLFAPFSLMARFSARRSRSKAATESAWVPRPPTARVDLESVKRQF